MTIQEFKKQYPQHSHLEGEEAWDVMRTELLKLNDTAIKYVESKDGFSEFKVIGREGLAGEGDMENEHLSPEEIAAKRIAEQERINKSKQEGTYGDLFEMKISMEEDSSFEYTKPTTSTESYRMEIIDFSNLPKREIKDPYEGLTTEEKINKLIQEKRIEDSWRGCSPYDK